MLTFSAPCFVFGLTFDCRLRNPKWLSVTPFSPWERALTFYFKVAELRTLRRKTNQFMWWIGVFENRNSGNSTWITFASLYEAGISKCHMTIIHFILRITTFRGHSHTWTNTQKCEWIPALITSRPRQNEIWPKGFVSKGPANERVVVMSVSPLSMEECWPLNHTCPQFPPYSTDTQVLNTHTKQYRD